MQLVPGLKGVTVGQAGIVYVNGEPNPVSVNSSNHELTFIRGRTYQVAHLVCMAYHGPRPTPRHTVNHKDGGRLNNHPDNVEWMTQAQNNQHAWDTGLYPRTKNHPAKRFTDDQVRDIRARIATTSDRKLAREYNCGRNTIRNCADRKAYQEVA